MGYRNWKISRCKAFAYIFKVFETLRNTKILNSHRLNMLSLRRFLGLWSQNILIQLLRDSLRVFGRQSS